MKVINKAILYLTISITLLLLIFVFLPSKSYASTYKTVHVWHCKDSLCEITLKLYDFKYNKKKKKATFKTKAYWSWDKPVDKNCSNPEDSIVISVGKVKGKKPTLIRKYNKGHVNYYKKAKKTKKNKAVQPLGPWSDAFLDGERDNHLLYSSFIRQGKITDFPNSISYALGGAIETKWVVKSKKKIKKSDLHATVRYAIRHDQWFKDGITFGFSSDPSSNVAINFKYKTYKESSRNIQVGR